MNPYYQVYEEPKKRSRVWVIVVAGAVVVLALILLVMMALPKNTGEEPGGDGSGAMGGDSVGGGDTVGMDGDGPAVLTEAVTEAATEPPISKWDEVYEDPEHTELGEMSLRAVYRYDKYEEDVRAILRDIAEREGTETHRYVQLFDMDLDGEPELVVIHVPEVKKQILTVYELDERREVASYACGCSMQKLTVTATGDPVRYSVVMDIYSYIDTNEALSIEESEQKRFVIDADYREREILLEYHNRGSSTYIVEGEQVGVREFEAYKMNFEQTYVEIEKTAYRKDIQWYPGGDYEKIVSQLFSRANGQRLVVIE